jgi:hypothetical protein
LGYPQVVSLESFRTPNFEMMGKIIKWLLHRQIIAHEVMIHILMFQPIIQAKLPEWSLSKVSHPLSYFKVDKGTQSTS